MTSLKCSHLEISHCKIKKKSTHNSLVLVLTLFLFSNRYCIKFNRRYYFFDFLGQNVKKNTPNLRSRPKDFERCLSRNMDVMFSVI